MRLVPDGYLTGTRHPWPCLLFLLPLLCTYEAGVLYLGGARQDLIRNGADTWLRWALESFGLPPVYCAPGLLIVLLLFWSCCRWWDRPYDMLGIWTGMVIESGLFAIGLWIASRHLAPLLQQMSVAMQMGFRENKALVQVVTYVGAGIYEEMIFRLLLFTVLTLVLRLLFVPGLLLRPAILLISAMIFAAAHHLGPYGEPFDSYVFWFRAFAGLYFGLLYQFRGFGIAVGAHAGYDVLVGVLMT